MFGHWPKPVTIIRARGGPAISHTRPTLTPPPPEQPEPPLVEAVPRRDPLQLGSEIASWVVIGAALWFILARHMVVALIAGLIFYLLLDRLSLAISRRVTGRAVRPLALIAGTALAGSAIAGAIFLAGIAIRRTMTNLPALLTKMADILDSTRAWLGGYGKQIIPEVMSDADVLKATIARWLKAYASDIGNVTEIFGLGLIHVIMGLLLAVLVFLRHVRKGREHDPHGPLAAELLLRVRRFAAAFAQIVTAQVKISAVNTILTMIYLLVVLPLAGKPLPFATTIVIITFLCGLLPVVGNLISNSVIVVVSLGTSVGTAAASLLFLVVIHKLEYLVNSKIVGVQTNSQAWEILLAIIVGEVAFGIPGVVMGPIVYAFIKYELRAKGLV